MRSLSIIASAMAASAAVAASGAIPPVPPAYRTHMPPEQLSPSGIVYVTGGKSPAEADSVKRAAQDFPLELVFREQDGSTARPLYDNPVVIRDALGKVVFATRTDGPYLLARLPEGQYTVTTHWDSWSFSRPVTITPERRERVVFAWKKVPLRAGDAANG